MPKLNRKLFFALVLLTTLLGGGLFAAHYVQSGRVTDALLWQAESHAEEGDTQQAVHYLRQYLELRPDDVESIVKLCDLLGENGTNARSANQMLFLYEKVLRIEPEHDEARRMAVELCLTLGRHHDALTHLQKLMPAHPEDGTLHRQFAVCKMAANELEPAAEALAKAVEYSPEDVRAYELLAFIQVNKFRKKPEAKETLDRMVEKNPDDPDAMLVRATFRKAVGDNEACEADLRRLLAADPGNADGVLMLTELMQARGEIHAVREQLNDAIEKHPKDVRLYRSLSWLELCSGNRPASIACLKRGIEEAPGAIDLITPLADLLIQDGDTRQAGELLASLESQRSIVPTQLAYLKARIAMGERDWETAIARLDSLRSEAVDLPALAAQVNLLLSICHHNRAETEKELAALERALEIDPGNTSARMSAGNLHLNAGEFDAAIREYSAVVASAYAPMDARILLGRLKIGQARNTGEGWDAVAEFINAAREKYPEAPEPVILSARMHKTRGDIPAADKLLREAVVKTPAASPLWAELAELRAEAYGGEAAFEVLDDAGATVGDRIEFRLARARLWADDPSPTRMGQVSRAERGLERFAEPDQSRLLHGMADLYDGMGDRSAMRRVYRMIADHQPENVGVRLELAELARAEGDAEAISRLKNELGKLGGDGEIALAVIDQNADKLAEYLRREPANADVRAALGRIAEAAGDAEEAGRHFAMAYDLDRARLSRLRELVAFRLRHGQDAEARKRLAELYRDPRVPVTRFRALFASATAELSDDRFRQCAGWIKPLTDADPNSRVWLGDLAWRRDLTDEAASHYRAAVAMAPSRPEAHLRLIRAAADDAGKAAAVLAEASKAMTPEAAAMLAARATVLMRELGRDDWRPAFADDKAKADFARSMLRTLMRREELVEAKGFLQAFAAGQSVTPGDMKWANRNLALLRAISGDEEEQRVAVAELRQMAADKGATVEDRRAHASVLTVAYRHLEGSQRQEILNAAIESLESAGDSAKPSETFSLAHLYRRAGNQDKFIATLKRLADAEPDNPAYVTAYVEALLDEGRTTEAGPWVMKFGAERAGELRGVHVMAKYRHLTDEPGEALKLAEGYVRAVAAGSNEAPRRLRETAEMLDELSRLAPGDHPESCAAMAKGAARYYRECLTGQPDAAVPLAALLARNGDAEGAFAQLVRSGNRLSDRAKIAGGLELIRTGHAEPHHFDQIREWIDAAAVARPDSLAVKLSLGEFYTLKRDYEAAAKAYRVVLEQDPKNVIALNNLAWVLAPDPASSGLSLKYVDQAIDLAGRNAELLDTRARALIARGSEGDYQRAVADLTEALGERQTSLRYFHLAVAKLKQSENDEAVDAFRKAQARGLQERMIHPTDMSAYRALSARLGS